VAEALAMRGFAVGEPGEEETDVVLALAGATRGDIAAEAEGAVGPSISYDVPADETTLLERHEGDAEALVLVEPREMPHLREIARRALLRPRAVLMPAPEEGRAHALESFRSDVRRALAEEDLAAQMLVLEPLFQEFPASEVAAALAALLRTRRPVAAPATATAPSAAQPSARPATPADEAARPVGAPPATWARLYVGVGSRDDVRPGDLVGAIAGEANIPGSRVGRIDIRDTFSLVEVQADVADQVIRAVNGTTIKGRSVRVDFDRGGDRARKPPMRRGPGGTPGGAPGGAGARPGGERMPRRRPRE
jgi:ATP-dependent RNA helicase DeaD